MVSQHSRLIHFSGFPVTFIPKSSMNAIMSSISLSFISFSSLSAKKINEYSIRPYFLACKTSSSKLDNEFTHKGSTVGTCGWGAADRESRLLDNISSPSIMTASGPFGPAGLVLEGPPQDLSLVFSRPRFRRRESSRHVASSSVFIRAKPDEFGCPAIASSQFAALSQGTWL